MKRKLLFLIFVCVAFHLNAQNDTQDVEAKNLIKSLGNLTG